MTYNFILLHNKKTAMRAGTRKLRTPARIADRREIILRGYSGG